jgi:hypothetical protein
MAAASMFEMFTDRARRVVVLAQEEARRLNHNYIGTEHLLLGLTHQDEGVAAQALESLGVGRDALRHQVEQAAGRGQQTPSGHIPFTAPAKKALELATRESKDLGHGFIDTEHLLLGLIREGHGVAAQVLGQFGAELSRVRHEVIELRPGSSFHGASGTAPRLGKRSRTRAIDETRAQLAAVDQRLSVIERWVGMTPGVDDLERELAHVRREKESAIDSQEFETAAALRDKEKDLIASKASREQGWAATAADRLPLAQELGQVKAELERLRAVLRKHGIEPEGGAA